MLQPHVPDEGGERALPKFRIRSKHPWESAPHRFLGGPFLRMNSRAAELLSPASRSLAKGGILSSSTQHSQAITTQPASSLTPQLELTTASLQPPSFSTALFLSPSAPQLLSSSVPAFLSPPASQPLCSSVPEFRSPLAPQPLTSSAPWLLTSSDFN
eukprot:CAMPEP_0184296620 /NCGR_PEP_ID=MMETSP1049-20130417/7585_1 /TAXON_ID=77928 /ORGANISM="Proteomonas sulcata, Strain CCMP704" /LENGTH=156 /DNA_ID=CAMNT_0026605947 /DNA_START=252 /DNA_END=723 /DNA_ORIENTATION=-